MSEVKSCPVCKNNGWFPIHVHVITSQRIVCRLITRKCDTCDGRAHTSEPPISYETFIHYLTLNFNRAKLEEKRRTKNHEQ